MLSRLSLTLGARISFHQQKKKKENSGSGVFFYTRIDPSRLRFSEGGDEL
jgi:hypothetical protein